MPVPKKRHSNTRTRTRRANWKLKPLNLGKCTQCGSPVLSHHACSNCGTYQGRTVLNLEAKASKKEAKKQKQASAQQQGGEEKAKS